MRVQAAPPEHYPWLCERVHYMPTVDLRAIEAVDSAGKVRGIVGYDTWRQSSVRMHVAVDGPGALRALLEPAFVYPFVQAGRSLLLAFIPSHSTKHLALARGLGFVETYRIRDGHDVGDDVLLFEMRKADCRWLRGKAS